MSDFEKTLLSNLIHNEDFTRRTIPFIKEDFFRNRDEVTLFKIITWITLKYIVFKNFTRFHFKKSIDLSKILK